MKVIICNSTPQSGKDVFANYISDNYGYEHRRFKTKLITLVKEIFNISEELWEEVYVSDKKDMPHEKFNGKTPREAMIFVSEVMVKPNMGKAYFGTIEAECLLDDRNYIYSDGGFYDEIIEVVNKVGKDNVVIVELKRDGCNFDRDSRTTVNVDGVKRIVFDNNGSIDELYKLCDAFIQALENGEIFE